MLCRYFAILLVAAFTSSASATTILFSSSIGGRSAFDASLNPLPDGDLFLVGTFSNVGGITLASTAAAVLASGGWSQFDGTRTTSTLGGNSGKLTGTAQDNTATAVPFNQSLLYVVIFNNASAANATQMGIFRAPTVAIGASWVFPTNDGGINDSATISMNETTVAAVGGVGSTTSSPQRFVLTALVPEPSAVGLIASGILGLLGYRRLRGRI
jgi:hypothetical protein